MITDESITISRAQCKNGLSHLFAIIPNKNGDGYEITQCLKLFTAPREVNPNAHQAWFEMGTFRYIREILPNDPK